MIVLRRAAVLSLAGLLIAASGLCARPAAAIPGEPGAVGDIPDTQAFVRYAARDGYTVLVPEGWSRTVRGASTTFTSHYDGVRIAVTARMPPVAAVRALGVRANGITTARASIAGRPAMRLTFSSSSQPDDVTGKTLPLDEEAYVFVKGNRQAVLLLWAPHGADNADQWRRIAQSFRW